MLVTYGVLGPLEAAAAGRPLRLGGPRQRSVLAVLLLRTGQVVPTDVLIDAVWGDDPPESAANLIQGYVSGLRKEIGRDSIETTDPGYRMTVPPDAFDLRRFERWAADGSAALSRGRPGQALEQLGAAIDLWRGPALADLPADGLLGACAARLEELRLASLERRAEALLIAGRAPEAVVELAAIVRDRPLREEPRALLMLGLYRCGRQAEALDVFRVGRQILVTELGIEPGLRLSELESAILRHDPDLDLRPSRDEHSPGIHDDRRRPGRTVLVAALDMQALPALVGLAETLVGGEPDQQLIIVSTVADPSLLAGATAVLDRHRTELDRRGVHARVAAFTSLTPGPDLARMATDQDADLCLVDAPAVLLEDPRLTALLNSTPCDVAVFLAADRHEGPVLVTFAGAEHDWAAVDLGARYSRRTGAALVLVGALAGGGHRDASRLLANASLAVQRAYGVIAVPLLVEPEPDALVAACCDAGLVVIGLTDRWRSAGLGRARSAVATSSGHPTLLVRRGLRPGGLAARDPDTRYTWTVAPT